MLCPNTMPKKRVNKKSILSLRLPSKCSFTPSKLRFFGLRKPKTTSFIHSLRICGWLSFFLVGFLFTRYLWHSMQKSRGASFGCPDKRGFCCKPLVCPPMVDGDNGDIVVRFKLTDSCVHARCTRQLCRRTKER